MLFRTHHSALRVQCVEHLALPLIGFGSGAVAASEPRQIRKEAAIRRIRWVSPGSLRLD